MSLLRQPQRVGTGAKGVDHALDRRGCFEGSAFHGCARWDRRVSLDVSTERYYLMTTQRSQ
jgi:hypothetical protein